jgi:wobble nucleotide-excising tRNase
VSTEPAAAQKAVRAYNRMVSESNAAINRCKESVSAGDLVEAEANLANLEAVKRRHDADAVELCESYTKLGSEKRSIEDEKASVRGLLEDHGHKIVRPYESRINHFLDRFNAGFRIASTGHGYPGGVAASTYQLLIDGNQVGLGDAKTALDLPSFKNTLSTGDRTTLGLAFFLASVEREPDLANRIVVFDDPFGSHDAFRRRQTIYEIMRIGAASGQLIVLSHDVQFLKQLWEKSPHNSRTGLQINYYRANGSKIAEFDLEQASRGRAAAELDDLLAFRANSAGNPREVIKKLRVVLETYLRSTFPSSFMPDDNLGGMLSKIRGGGAQHPAHAIYEDIERINDYTTDYHHGEDPRGAGEPTLDETELQGFVQTTLRLVNALPA